MTMTCPPPNWSSYRINTGDSNSEKQYNYWGQVIFAAHGKAEKLGELSGKCS
jgi:hypothetical protein